MPSYVVTAPDGKKFRITAPDGTTQDQVMAFAQSKLGNRPAAQPKEPSLADISPTAPSRAGYGAALPPPRGDVGDEEQVFTQRKALEAQGKGKGDPEWERLTRQLAEIKNKDTEFNASMAGTMGGGLETVGRGIKNLFQRVLAGGAPRDAATLAREAGYVLPPANISEDTSLATKAASGFSGKVKTQQSASAANQEVTTRLAKKALGLKDDVPLTEQAFQRVRQGASGAYQDVINAVDTINEDPEFKSAVAQLGGANSQAAQHFPGLMKNEEVSFLLTELGKVKSFPTEAGIELVKELRFNATANLKAIGDPAKNALGMAQREAADAIDDLIERNIARQTGSSTDLVQKYRAARQLIAKSHDVEAATNTATGEVDARAIAKLADKGKPLTGDLDTIAKVANAFPKAVQSPEAFGGVEDFSVLDFGAAGAAAMGGAAAGGPVGAAAGLAPLTRPVVRRAILSEPFQDLLTAGKPPPRPGIGHLAFPMATATTRDDQQPVGPKAAAAIGASQDF